MADIRLYAPMLFDSEGGFVNDPDDAGGATNMGVTLRTWRKVGYDIDGDGDIDKDDLKALSKADVIWNVLKPYYWDRWKADEIRTQAIANLLVDWVYNSGEPGIKIPQRILGVKDDGIVGPVTIRAVNDTDQEKLFSEILNARKRYYNDLVIQKPSQKKFLKGWMNRLKKFKL